MESDIIVEGFRLSEQVHGIRYMCAIGDDDSSVMANIRQYVVYGPFVEKVECANHACKCYRNRLEELAKDHPEFRGRGGLTKRAMQRLTTGVRVAIKMHSETGDVQQLRKDLQNSPAHVFGDHTKCNIHFCKHVPGHSSQQDNQAEDSSNPAEEVIDDQHYSDLREQLDAELRWRRPRQACRRNRKLEMVTRAHLKHYLEDFTTKCWHVVITWLCLLPN